jgi:hypothetical protein
MSRRKSIDFTINHEIHIYQGYNGKYWSKIIEESTGNPVWELKESTTYDDAATLAKYRLDALAEAWVEEGEPEDDGAGISEQEHCQRNGVPWCPKP